MTCYLHLHEVAVAVHEDVAPVELTAPDGAAVAYLPWVTDTLPPGGHR